MPVDQVSIGQVKRDISELVNRVAFGGERIVLTSRGKPKAVLVSVQDYEALEKMTTEVRRSRWRTWQQANEALSDQILARRQDEPIDVDELWQATKAELEVRDADFISG
jgi:prevent-host-death family protein